MAVNSEATARPRCSYGRAARQWWRRAKELLWRSIVAVYISGRDTAQELSARLSERWGLGAPKREEYIVRFDAHQRLQHFLMMATFLVLAFTGLPQKFHDFYLSQWLIAALGGLERTQFIHRTAAWVMLLDCLYHGLYLVYTIGIRRKLDPLRMIPSSKDFQDLGQTISWWFGFTEERPKADRFAYLEKFDYWAVFWGIAIMGGSGLILMYPLLATKVLPGAIVPVAHAAHSDEAVLAVGWIFLVHILRAHFMPGSFPFNTSIFTGQMPRHRYREEHPLEYERLVQRGLVPALEP